MAFKVVERPTAEPITLEELRAHLRLDANGEVPSHPDDALVLGYLSAAREHAELYVGFALAPQTLELALDEFPCDGDALELEGGEVSSVASVVYVSGAGELVALDPTKYVLDPYSTPAWLLPAYGSASWPETLPVANAVRVRYSVGAQPLSPSIRAALLLLVGHLYENREETSAVQTYALSKGVNSLLRLHRRMGV
jgi:uncharacterized phiE125 gp8 family phage protein